MGHQKYTSDQVIQALRNASGIQTEAAKLLDCSRQTVRNYIDRYQDVYRAWIQSRESFVDRCECKLQKIIENEDHPDHFKAVKFVLQTIGKERGYNDNVPTPFQGVEMSDNGEVDLSKLNKEELKYLRDLMKKAKN